MSTLPAVEVMIILTVLSVVDQQENGTIPIMTWFRGFIRIVQASLEFVICIKFVLLSRQLVYCILVECICVQFLFSLVDRLSMPPLPLKCKVTNIGIMNCSCNIVSIVLPVKHFTTLGERLRIAVTAILINFELATSWVRYKQKNIKKHLFIGNLKYN